MHLCLLTAVLSGNAGNAKIEDIEGNRWTIPADAFKAGQPHTVILSRQAMELIDQNRGDRTSGWLFPSATGKPVPTSGERVRVLLKRCAIDNIRPHDFRRAIRTWASERGVSVDVGERLLGRSKGGVRGIYDRATDNIPAGEVWQQWADYLDSLAPAPGNVVSIKRQS